MSITLIIVIITSLISFNAFNNPALKAKFIFNPYIIIRNKDYKRFITSGLIHGDFLHLFFNMFVFWMFGSYVEQIFQAIYGTAGLVLFVTLYVLAIIVADIPSFIKYKDSPHYNALGASGGVSAILFSFIIFNPLQDICLYGLLCLPGFIWGVLYVIYSFYMGKQQGDNINHNAHLIGGLFGVIFTIITVPGVISSFIEQLIGYSLF